MFPTLETRQTEPSAAECLVEALVEGDSNARLLTVRVDCSAVKNNASLVFQLTVSRRDATQLFSKLLFAALTGGRPQLNIPIGELAEPSLQLDQDTDEDEDDSGAKMEANSTQNNNNNNNSPAQRKQAKELEQQFAKIITLDEQVNFLNELVFTIRASNLIKTSEPRAIFGSELQVNRSSAFERPPQATYPSTNDDQLNDQDTSATGNTGNNRRPLARSHRPLMSDPMNLSSSFAVGQVSRSPPVGLDSSLSPEPIADTIAVVQPASRRNGSARLAGSSSTWPTGGGHELGITIAALCGLAVLSALTLTLIVLVLRSRKLANHESSGQAIEADRKPSCRRIRFECESAPETSLCAPVSTTNSSKPILVKTSTLR